MIWAEDSEGTERRNGSVADRCCAISRGKTAPKDTEQNLEVKGNQLQNKIPFLFKATEIPATCCLQLVSLCSFNSNVF